MATLKLIINTRKPLDLGVTPGGTTLNRGGRQLYRRAVNAAMGAIGEGSDFVLNYTSATPAAACAAGAISSGSGAVGCVLNGVTLTDTWATSDAVGAALAAAAINTSSNALVLGFVKSCNLRMTITLASVAAADEINICGTRFVAISGTAPALSSYSGVNKFDISGNNAADATALAASIMAAPGLNQWVYALAVSDVVYVFARQFTYSAPTFSWPTGPGVPPNLVTTNASTFTLSGSTLAASANFGICACEPGVLGNAMGIAASGTGVTMLNSATYLTGGTSGGIVATLGRS